VILGSTGFSMKDAARRPGSAAFDPLPDRDPAASPQTARHLATGPAHTPPRPEPDHA
jgi:hypothetical protein